MTQPNRGAIWTWWVVCTVFVLGAACAGWYYLTHGADPVVAASVQRQTAPDHGTAVRVEVTHPQKGARDRTSTQPGSVQAFESVDLYAEVSGFLKTQSVDIGDHVKKGQALATVDVPELEKQIQRNASMLDQAKARVQQMKARVVSAQADLEAAKAGVSQAESTSKSKAAELRFREQQLQRMRELFKLKSIDERLVDEKTEQRDAAREAEYAAIAGVATSKAQVAASAAKIQQAEADVVEAEAEVRVAQAELEKAQVLVQFATIASPFDGVITRRNFFPADFVRSANEGSARMALLTVQRTDKMRVVVQVPDRDVPYTVPGIPALVEIDALPGQKFSAQVSRVAQSEDPDTRLMHVEIDLPNPSRKIAHGMFGRVTIILDRSEVLTLPSSCLVGKTEDGKGSVYVIREGRAHLVSIQISQDDGVRVAILGGLRVDDEVVLRPGSGLGEGVPVLAAPEEPANVSSSR